MKEETRQVKHLVVKAQQERCFLQEKQNLPLEEASLLQEAQLKNLEPHKIGTNRKPISMLSARAVVN